MLWSYTIIGETAALTVTDKVNKEAEKQKSLLKKLVKHVIFNYLSAKLSGRKMLNTKIYVTLQ